MAPWSKDLALSLQQLLLLLWHRFYSWPGNFHMVQVKLKHIYIYVYIYALCGGFSTNIKIVNICLSPSLSVKDLSGLRGSQVEKATVIIHHKVENTGK